MQHESPSYFAATSAAEEYGAGGMAVAELEHVYGGEESLYHSDAGGFADDFDSTCSTPYMSAPSSPGRAVAGGCYFFSAPASPMHYILSTPPYSVSSSTIAAQSDASFNGSVEFEFSAKHTPLAGTGASGSMSSADELFLNGQIRPMKLSSHLQHPQILGPLLDVDQEEENAKEMCDSSQTGRDLRSRSRSIHRRTRSMSPSRNARFQWQEDDDGGRENNDSKEDETDPEKEAEVFMPSASASSSRSSSSGRNSKRWVFIKELLYRSKSEGRANAKEKFWLSISFSPSKDKSKPPPIIHSPSSPLPSCESSQKQSNKNASQSTSSSSTSTESSKKPKTTNGIAKRRLPAPSAHEKLYTANRAQTEELRKKTFLPYRQGLLGCLGFSSRSYGAMNGLAKTLKTVS
ncbi:hypothetical protein KSP40_PGU017219 [Platanthera guangdongensis]|uniref:Calmodulin-binding protein n=1 Tax=Platanthera guangdongensis TaxID=2320717 RepID=A0ABR2M780_9ASPA